MSTSVPPPHPSGPPVPPPSPTDSFFDGIRRAGIVRSDDRWIGGVAGGVSLRAGVDPLVGRALFVLAAFLGGIGLIAYGIGWALLPEQRDGRIHLQQLFRGHFDAAVVGAFLVTAAGFSSAGVRPWWGLWRGEGWSGLLWITVLVLVVVVVVSASRSSRPDGGRPYAPPPAGPQPFAPGGVAPAAPAPTTDVPTDAPTSGETMPPASPTPPSAATTGTSATAHGAATHAATAYGPQPATAYGDRPPAAGYGPGAHGAAGPHGTPYGAGGPYAPGGPYGPHGPRGGAPAPARPPVPPKPVVRGAGAAATGVVVGLGLLTFAALMFAQRYTAWDGPVLLTAGAVTVVLAGLAIVVAGARGRSSGGLGAVAVLTSLVLLPVAALQPGTWSPDAVVTGVGEVRQTPVTISEAERGFTVGAGEARIDLTDLPTRPGEVIEVPIAVGAGEATVTMPRDAAYTASVRVFAGDVRWLGDRVRSGVGNQFVELESPAVRDGAEPRVHLRITVGAGEVTVVEAGR